MKNYICINDQKIELSDEQVRQITAAYGQPNRKLSDVAVGDIAKIGGYEFLVLEQMGDSTAVICKDLIGSDSEFGEKNNNYNGSCVDEICNSFFGAVADAVGEANVLLHTVDLTSDDGLKDYGTVERRVSLLTTEQYRRYVEILDNYKPDRWWLATPYSTKRHENDCWVKCVSPSGNFCSVNYYGRSGVRPFCILKSSIFESSEA